MVHTVKSIHTPECRVLLGWLRTERRQAGLTMRAVARRLGVPHSWIGKVETGERRLDVPEYVRLCRAIGADPQAGVRLVASRIDPDWPATAWTAAAVAETQAPYARRAARKTSSPRRTAVPRRQASPGSG